MHFYDLPDVIIDYIYSFDSNYYYRKIYNKVLTELLTIRARLVTNRFLCYFHQLYDIYYSYMTRYFIRETMNVSQYIFDSFKQYGIQIIIDKLMPSYITKSYLYNRNFKLIDISTNKVSE